MIEIRCERPADAGQIEHLLDMTFGPGRFAKTAYRLREAVAPVAALSMTAWEDGAMRGSIRYWPVLIGPSNAPALLLGPLAVDPAHRGRGIAISLMETTLEKAAGLGYQSVVLVGDAPYYARVGFSAVSASRLRMPGPVDQNRLLARELVPGALEGVAGLIRKSL